MDDMRAAERRRAFIYSILGFYGTRDSPISRSTGMMMFRGGINSKALSLSDRSYEYGGDEEIYDCIAVQSPDCLSILVTYLEAAQLLDEL